MKKQYTVAAVGTGMIFNGAHLPAVQSLGERMRFVAVCDERSEAARFDASRLSVPVYTCAESMLRETHPDILLVCTPNATHKKYALMGLEAGAHVVCEKPVALTIADAREILEAAERTGRRFFAAQTGRFTADQMIARKWVQDGLIGKPYYADINIIRRRGVPQWGQFHIKEHNLAGAFADMGVHNIDALLAMCGNPRLISASARSHSGIISSGEQVMISNKESGALDGTFIPSPFDAAQMDVEEFVVGLLSFEGGLNVSFRTAWAIDLPDDSSMCVVGTKGGLDISRMKLYQTIGGCQATIEQKVFDNTANVVPHWGHWECYRAILKDLDGEQAYPVTPEQMLNTAAVLEAVYTSAAKNREVCLEEIAAR